MIYEMTQIKSTAFANPGVSLISWGKRESERISLLKKEFPSLIPTAAYLQGFKHSNNSLRWDYDEGTI